MLRWIGVFCLLCLAAVIYGDDNHESKLKKVGFQFVSAQNAGAMQILECPDHAFGTREEGLKELKKRLADGKVRDASFIQICINNQHWALKECGSLVDCIALNPFVFRVDNNAQYAAGKDEDATIWPGCSHPVITHLRSLSYVRPPRLHLLARIDLSRGEPGLWYNRTPSPDDLRWCLVLLLGARYNGVIWVGEKDSDHLTLRTIEKEFDFLTTSKSAFEVSSVNVVAQNALATLLETDKTFVLCVLSPQYVVSKSSTKEDTWVSSPLDRQECEFSIKFENTGLFLKTPSKTLYSSTKPLSVIRNGKDVTFSHVLSGPCNIYVWGK